MRLTTAGASSTYEPQSAMSSYLTTSAAASTYQPKGSYVDLSSAQTMTGFKEFSAAFDPATVPNNTWGVVANSTTTNKTMTLDGNGNLYTAGTYSSGSSAKLKKDIHYLDPSEQDRALKMVLDTPITTYRYKRSSEQSKPVYGVIAETTPSPMLTDDNQGVNLTNTVGVLLASVKAQQARIAELQARLDKLEKRRSSAPHRAGAVAAPLQ